MSFQTLTSANAEMATYDLTGERMGFFTDTTLCIGCKACEVACKEWNHLPADGYSLSGESYDNTGALSGTTWRHVAFVEQFDGEARDLVAPLAADGGGRWLMSSDVCKHCTHAACLDVCPTGALFRTEFGTVVVQDDVCNGCGYCVPACPFGVIDRRPDTGRAAKCTLCYDRLKDGQKPACAKACPTESIQFGELSVLRERAQKRLEKTATINSRAQLYGADQSDGVGGFGAFFLLTDSPEVYGLPPAPTVTTRDLGAMWKAAALAGAALAAAMVVCAIGSSDVR
ncbi:MAG: 4Fe-4S dicluster domain-containing protein [Candidatus Eremiobacteraeota bacterium]|nr:4Fe-4S dicluster domain-containing protein [Candidatus Eremiobacteraeota bacterium]